MSEKYCPSQVNPRRCQLAGQMGIYWNADSRSSLMRSEPGPESTRLDTAWRKESYTMEASESGIPSLTEDPLGHERWWMWRTFNECLRRSAPSSELQKWGSGGDRKGPWVRPLATWAVMSAEMASECSAADLRLEQVCEWSWSSLYPRLYPWRMMCINVSTTLWSGYSYR